jgi:GNAT superfamily N-acetyltransferase
MNHDFAALVRRLETAQALQGRSFLLETQRKSPTGPARALRGRWGFAHYFAEGHFLNQALALGLAGPVSARQLDRIEALLGRGGHPVVLELAPAADPGLTALVADRGYRIQAFQQVLARALGETSGMRAVRASRVQVHCAKTDEMEVWRRVVHAGFQNLDALPVGEEAPVAFDPEAQGNRFLLATVDGEPAGAAVLGCFQNVGVCSATSVLPRFRGLGAQRALIEARLALARDAGCAWACAAVLPGAASQANLERCGFAVVYPKLEMARTAG